MPVNTGLADLSNNLTYSAIAVYAIAMVLYAAELAFGTRGVVARTAGATAGSTSSARTSAGRGAGGATATLERPRSGSTGGRGGAFGAAAAGRNAVALTLLGFVLQVGALATRGLSAHRVPWGNMYEFSTAAALAAVGAFLVLLARRDVRYLGFFVLAPVVLTLGVAVTLLYVDASELVPALDSYWLVVHVSAAVVSSGVFTIGAAFSLLHLWKDRAERRGRPVGRVLAKMPSADALERSAYRVHAFGFPLWTFAVIAGAIWAENAWGRYWGWDPKETWAFITWVVYAAYLHARATGGWKGRRASRLALLAYATFLFNYFAVNILFVGLHSYGGV